ncbi:MAG: DUF3703 domain-containing protein, partial [Flavobacteriales bacterium]|nr:DUF3703 domain-containing protein [Flavobacteriales bacterium]
MFGHEAQLKMPSLGLCGPYYNAEFEASAAARAQGDLGREWYPPSNALIFSASAGPWSTMRHWRMLKFGFRYQEHARHHRAVATVGFRWRKSFVGTVPIGNTGGVNVPPLRPCLCPKTWPTCWETPAQQTFIAQ